MIYHNYSLNLYTIDFIINETDLINYGLKIYDSLSDHVRYLVNKFPEYYFYIYSHTQCTIDPYAIAVFRHGEFSEIFFNLNKSKGSLGVRETNKLKDIIEIKIKDFSIESLVKKELNNYFGKAKPKDHLLDKNNLEYSNSSYKLQKDFSIDLVRLKDGLKAINPSIRNLYQLNKCSAGEDININEFARSLDSVALPFHRCTIEFKTMQSSINNLSSKYFSILSAFYFPERKCKYKEEYQSILRLKDDNYKKAWKLKDKSLIALIDNIMNIQYLESEIS